MIAGRVYVLLGARIRGFTAGMTRASNIVQAFGRRVNQVGAKMKRFGSGMTMRLTLPIVGALAFGVKSFADFDKAMTESTAIMGDLSDATKKRMEDIAITISEKLTPAASELAAAYFYLASAGMSAAESMSNLENVAMFAQAGAFGLSRATEMSTDAQHALGLTSKNLAKNQAGLVRVMDNLVRANTLADATVEQFAKALTSKAGVAAFNAGKSIEEVVAVLAVFANKGIKAEEAGEAFSIMMRDLQKSVRGEPAVWKKFGLSVFDVGGNFRNVADIVEDLSSVLLPMSAKGRGNVLMDLGFQFRSVEKIKTLLGTSSALRVFQKELENAGGTMEDVAKRQMESFSNQLKVTWNNVKNASKAIGKILAPAILWVGEKVKEFTYWFRGLNEETKVFAVKVMIAVAAIGPLAVVIGGLIAIVGAAITTIVTGLLAISLPLLLAIGGFVILGAQATMALKDQAGGWRELGIQSLGVIFNIQENMTRFYDWMNVNWKIMIGNMVKMFATVPLTMVENMKTGLSKIFDLLRGKDVNIMKGWKTGFEGIFKGTTKLKLKTDFGSPVNKSAIAIEDAIDNFLKKLANLKNWDVAFPDTTRSDVTPGALRKGTAAAFEAQFRGTPTEKNIEKNTKSTAIENKKQTELLGQIENNLSEAGLTEVYQIP